MDSTRLEIAGTLSLQRDDGEVRSLVAEISLIFNQVARLSDEVAGLKKTVEGSMQRGEERDSYASKLLTMLEKQSDDGFYKTFLQRPVEKLIDLRELVLAEADTPTLDVHLVEALEAFNIGTVSAEPGTAFDPAHHEAVDVVAVADESDVGRVVEVLRQGYLRGGALMRPAQVRVAQLTRGEEERHEESHLYRHGDHLIRGFDCGSSDRAAVSARESRRQDTNSDRCLVPPR